MAKIKITPKKPPPKKSRARVSVTHLIAVCGALTTPEVFAELRRLKPNRKVLLKFLATLKTVHADAEIMTEVLRYCDERECNPNKPPVARYCRQAPVNNSQRTYNVQFTKNWRPYLKLPLDTLEDPKNLKRVIVDFSNVEIRLRPSPA